MFLARPRKPLNDTLRQKEQQVLRFRLNFLINRIVKKVLKEYFLCKVAVTSSRLTACLCVTAATPVPSLRHRSSCCWPAPTASSTVCCDTTSSNSLPNPPTGRPTSASSSCHQVNLTLTCSCGDKNPQGHNAGHPSQNNKFYKNITAYGFFLNT